ncbi:MAG: hypothetical protein ABL899_00120 [Nitrospira sp.]
MHPNPKRISLFILAVTSVVLSRTMLVSLNDPEGPNLLIVMVMAGVVYAPSWFVYSRSKQGSFRNVLIPMLIQSVFVTGLYFCLN